MSTEQAITKNETNTNPDLDWGFDSEKSAGNAHQVAADALAKAKAPEVVENTLIDRSALPAVEGVVTTEANASPEEGGSTESADEAKGAAEASNALAELQKRKAEAMRKVEEKFEAKEFALRRKSVSMGVRKTVAFELMEVMRGTVREKLNSPYMDDAEADKLIGDIFNKSFSG
jgi:hypothetical protein